LVRLHRLSGGEVSKGRARGGGKEKGPGPKTGARDNRGEKD
jgi:hypothetical protein